MAKGKKPATHEDIYEPELHLVRAEPFDVVPLGLGALWLGSGRAQAQP